MGGREGLQFGSQLESQPPPNTHILIVSLSPPTPTSSLPPSLPIPPSRPPPIPSMEVGKGGRRQEGVLAAELLPALPQLCRSKSVSGPEEGQLSSCAINRCHLFFMEGSPLSVTLMTGMFV